jgi:hypothetical protein
MRLAAQADAPGACETVLAAPLASTGAVYGAAAWLWPGSSELAVCRRELRSRPVILRHAWSEPKENKVDPGETLCRFRADSTGNTLTPPSPNPPGDVRKGFASCWETTSIAA